jgi:hypothetical protein
MVRLMGMVLVLSCYDGTIKYATPAKGALRFETLAEEVGILVDDSPDIEHMRMSCSCSLVSWLDQSATFLWGLFSHLKFKNMIVYTQSIPGGLGSHTAVSDERAQKLVESQVGTSTEVS